MWFWQGLSSRLPQVFPLKDKVSKNSVSYNYKLFESVTLLVVSNIDLAQMKGALSRFREPHENQRQRDLLETESGKSPSVRLLPRAPGFPVEGNLPLPAPASCFPLSTPHFLSRSTAFAVSQSSLHMVHTAPLASLIPHACSSQFHHSLASSVSQFQIPMLMGSAHLLSRTTARRSLV